MGLKRTWGRPEARASVQLMPPGLVTRTLEAAMRSRTRSVKGRKIAERLRFLAMRRRRSQELVFEPQRTTRWMAALASRSEASAALQVSAAQAPAHHYHDRAVVFLAFRGKLQELSVDSRHVSRFFESRVDGNAGRIDALLRYPELLHRLCCCFVGNDVEIQVGRDSQGMRDVIGQDYRAKRPGISLFVLAQNPGAVEVRGDQNLGLGLLGETPQSSQGGSSRLAAIDVRVISLPVRSSVLRRPELRNLGYPLMGVGSPTCRALLGGSDFRHAVYL